VVGLYGKTKEVLPATGELKTLCGHDAVVPTWQPAQEWCNEMPKNGRIFKQE